MKEKPLIIVNPVVRKHIFQKRVYIIKLQV